MATITFSLDIPESKKYNISEFQQKLKAYARILVEMPMLPKTRVNELKNSKKEVAATENVLSREEAEKFIHSLPIRGGISIPADVNGIKDLFCATISNQPTDCFCIK